MNIVYCKDYFFAESFWLLSCKDYFAESFWLLSLRRLTGKISCLAGEVYWCHNEI